MTTDGFKHIAERTIDPIGQLASSGNSWINTDINYDVAIGGVPFLLGVNDKYPYKRATAEYRKQQLDVQKEPGEQTITGWWLRSQSSFHYGAGVRYQEPIMGEHVGNMFHKSAGVEVFNTGRVTLLPDVTKVQTVTNSPIVISAVDSGTDIVFFADGASLYRMDGGSPTSVTWGGSGNILDLAQDGQYYYAVNATGIYRGTLAGGTGSLIFTNPTTATSAKLGYAKQRIIAGINNSVYEVVPISTLNIVAGFSANNVVTLKTSVAHNYNVGYQVTVAGVGSPFNGTFVITSIPSATEFTYAHNYTDQQYSNALSGTVTLVANNNLPIYTHPASTWKWTGVADGPNAIYVAGYAGVSGSIFRLALDVSGAVPLLNKALTAAEMPAGEYVTALGSYLGKYLVIGTNKGVRVGQIDTSGWLSSGYITYGPLSFVTNGFDPGTASVLNGSAVTSVCFQDRFAYCTVTNYIDNGDGTFCSGLVKIDLSKEVGPNQFGYATNLRVSNATAACTSVANLGNSNTLVFGIAGVGMYKQSTTLVSSGYIQTGQIRQFTLEDKHFELLKVRVLPNQKGSITTSVINPDFSILPVITTDVTFDYTQDITALDNLDVAPQQSIGLRFTINSSTNQAVGTEDVFIGYQLKSVPAVKRQRLITFPLMNYDYMEDRNNMATGYAGRAAEKLSILEAIESNGDVILIQDFTNNETIRGIIEEQQFIRMTAPDRAFNGDGGMIYCTIRTVS
jgi:hypothetical protein